MHELIFKIEAAKSHARRLALFARLETYLAENARTKQMRVVKSLLYHPDWYIRQEAAHLIDRYGVPLSGDEQNQYFYALQIFDRLLTAAGMQKNIRRLLFEGCLDPSPRFRLRLFQELRHIAAPDGREKTLLCYAAADYPQLIERGCESEQRETVLACLRHGMAAENNPEYHRKQCAFALEQLKALENASAEVSRWLREKNSDEGDGMTSAEIQGLTQSPLEQLLHWLQKNGIRCADQRLFPEIRQRAATGRITYRNPGLQTWTKQKRREQLRPSPGHIWLKFDYRQMEPTLLLHFLLERFFISLEDIPPGDIYLAIDPGNRAAAKQWLNGVINGGGKRFTAMLNPLQMKLLDAISMLRQEMLQCVYLDGHISDIDGQKHPLSANVGNLGGKALNRLIQGSASAIFNHAVLRIHQQLQAQRLPGQVGFLLFDEVWIDAHPDAAEAISQTVLHQLTAVNESRGLLYPLSVRMEKQE